MTVVLLLAGFVALIAGGEVLVRGASRLGASFRLSPQVIGLTIVAFATSAPELAVSLSATAAGSSGLAIGNVVGSNVANILLVLGVTAVILPVAVRSRLVKWEIPVMILAAALLLMLAMDGTLSRVDGIILFVGLAAFITFSLVTERRSATAGPSAPAGASAPEPTGGRTTTRGLILNLVLVGAGVVLLVVGAQWLVSGARSVALAAGLSDLVIGLTVVAVGTSLPELATSIIAAVRGERELAIGNIVGSNLFNIGAVLGLTSILSPTGIDIQPGAITFDLPVMLVVSLAVLPIAFTGSRIGRREGVLFLAYYAAYITYLLLDAAGHDALPAFSSALLTFALPLTGFTLLLLVGHQWHLRRSGPDDPRRQRDRSVRMED